MATATAAKGRATAGSLSQTGSEGEEAWLETDAIFKISRRLPSDQKWLKEGEVVQCFSGERWVPRRLIMTKSSLYVTPQKDDRILSEIAFADVEELSRMQPATPARPHQTENVLGSQTRGLLHPPPSVEREDIFGMHIRATMFKGAHSVYFRALSKEEAGDWVQDLKQQHDMSSQFVPQLKWHEVARSRLTTFYRSNITQSLVAFLIFGNFIVKAIEAQLVPEEGSSQALTFERLDLGFTLAFTIELVINILVNWFVDFVSDGWNVFDVLVVTTSLVRLIVPDLPGVSILRIIRAFRVLRLFGRLGSLRRIVNALSSSWLPVLNAFAVVFFIQAVYAILGVTFFRDRNPALFGTFSAAFVTMFTVTTMEGWVDFMDSLYEDDTAAKPGAIIFFISFILIVVWTMLPVVVAILLDNFTKAATKEHDRENAEAEAHSAKGGEFRTLDPLMRILTMFTTEDELHERIATVFRMLNMEDQTTLGYEDLRDGFSMLAPPDAAIDFTREEYERLTRNGSLCDSEGRLGEDQFEGVMLRELRDFTERSIASALAAEMAHGSQGMVAALCSLKMQALETSRSKMQTRGEERGQHPDQEGTAGGKWSEGLQGSGCGGALYGIDARAQDTHQSLANGGGGGGQRRLLGVAEQHGAAAAGGDVDAQGHAGVRRDGGYAEVMQAIAALAAQVHQLQQQQQRAPPPPQHAVTTPDSCAPPLYPSRRVGPSPFSLPPLRKQLRLRPARNPRPDVEALSRAPPPSATSAAQKPLPAQTQGNAVSGSSTSQQRAPAVAEAASVCTGRAVGRGGGVADPSLSVSVSTASLVPLCRPPQAASLPPAPAREASALKRSSEEGRRQDKGTGALESSGADDDWTMMRPQLVFSDLPTQPQGHAPAENSHMSVPRGLSGLQADPDWNIR